MNEYQYNKICNVSDKLLLSRDSSVNRISIPFLHIVSEHPEDLKDYKPLFKKSKSSKIIRITVNLKNKLQYLKSFLKLFFCFFHKQDYWKINFKNIKNPINIILISHFINIKQTQENDDLYFDNIPKIMNQNNKKCILILINHTKIKPQVIVKNWKKNGTPILILSKSLNFSNELQIIYRCISEISRLKKLGKISFKNFDKEFINLTTNKILNETTMLSLRLNLQLKKIVKEYQPKTIVTTFEGNAWERVAFYSARTAIPSIKCIGYQHSRIFKLQHSFKRKLRPIYNPDYIITAGFTGQKILKKLYNKKNIICVGSHRLKQFNSKKLSKKLINKKSVLRCCVLPEGYITEAFKLFNFSLKCAIMYPEIEFVWRLHPHIEFKDIFNKYNIFKKLPKNIIISNKSFDYDLKRCDWTLYRGTTAVIQSVLYGLRPIYFKINGELPIDTLFEIKKWKVEVIKPEEISKIINHKQLQNKKLNSYKKSAQNYCKSYFKNFNLINFKKIINS